MSQTYVNLASDIFTDIVKGSEGEKIKAESKITDLDPEGRSNLRKKILGRLKDEFPYPEEVIEDNPLAWDRAWLLSTLARVCDDDINAKKTVRKHLEPDYEPSRWVRYWTLEGLITTKVPDIEELTLERVRDADETPLVQMLAHAVQASNKEFGEHKNSVTMIGDGLKDEEKMWVTLRGLRICPVNIFITPICKIINDKKEQRYGMVDKLKKDTLITYDAIATLGHVPKEFPHAKSAVSTLRDFIVGSRHSPEYDGMRARALKALGNLGDPNVASIIIEDITDDNPAIVSAASLALDKLVGSHIAVSSILVRAEGSNEEQLRRFASGLRYMKDYHIKKEPNPIVHELEENMVAGTPKQRETAQNLLIKLGGSAAYQKLQARTDVKNKYMISLTQAQTNVQTQFNDLMKEASTGFDIVTGMDKAIYYLGLFLIGISAMIALKNEGDLSGWAGVTVTGGGGVLGILYGKLIENPRTNVEDSVNYKMKLNGIFQGYLRQLSQIDHLFIRQLLEDEFSIEDMERFTNRITVVMDNALVKLSTLKDD